MKTTTIAFLAGFTASIFASVLVARKIKKPETMSRSTSIEVMRLRANLIEWLTKAPGRGYSALEIADYYNEQVAFIELISKV